MTLNFIVVMAQGYGSSHYVHHKGRHGFQYIVKHLDPGQTSSEQKYFNGPHYSTRISYQEKYSSVRYSALSYDPDYSGLSLKSKR